MLCLMLLGLVGPSAQATGLGGDTPPARIPIPARLFTAQFEDRKGTVVEAERVTFNGEVFVYGTVGAGQVTIPFEKLARVELGPASEKGKIEASATLKDGVTVKLVVDDDLVCYGATTYGNYAIKTADLRRIVFP